MEAIPFWQSLVCSTNIKGVVENKWITVIQTNQALMSEREFNVHLAGNLMRSLKEAKFERINSIIVRKISFFITLIMLSNLAIKSQVRNLNYNIEAIGGFTSSGHVPFWLRSNQYGSIPLDNASLSLIGAIRKDYDTAKNRIFDWGASIEGRVNVGHKSNLNLIEGYGKLRIGVFELRAGRSKEIMGLCDTTLTSGAFAVSGNALGIPKVQIAIPEFYSFPIFGKLFAFKGNFAHGWIGEIQGNMVNGSMVYLKTYLHQKSLYGRFGKPDWKLKLYSGFSHLAFWGNEKNLYVGNIYTLSAFKTYLYVITGKAYGTNSILLLKLAII